MKISFNVNASVITYVILLLSINLSFAQDDGGYEVKNIKHVKSQEGINTAPFIRRNLSKD